MYAQLLKVLFYLAITMAMVGYIQAHDIASRAESITGDAARGTEDIAGEAANLGTGGAL